MSKSRKSVSSFSDLLNLKAVQEIVCHNQAEAERAKLAETPIKVEDNKAQQMASMFEARKLQTQPKLSKKGLNQYRRFLDLPTR